MALVAPVAGPELAASLRALRRETATRISAPLDRNAVPARIARLRAELRGSGLAGFLIPRADEYQGEYVPLAAQRLLWLTGFEGSAGLAVVLLGEAAIFVDGRYTLQVRSQVPVDILNPHHETDNPPPHWISAHLPQGGRLGSAPRQLGNAA